VNVEVMDWIEREKERRVVWCDVVRFFCLLSVWFLLFCCLLLSLSCHLFVALFCVSARSCW